MAAKKKPAHASRKGAERQIPGWLWLLSGAVLGAFVMFIFHLYKLKQHAPLHPSEHAAKEHASESSKTRASNTKDDTKKLPEFIFYDSLKEEQVKVPDYSHQRAKNSEPTHHYYLQVASFSRKADAENARAQLILLNLQASVETSTLPSGNTAYRTIIGPYTNKSKLAKARETLVSNGFEYLLLKRKI